MPVFHMPSEEVVMVQPERSGDVGRPVASRGAAPIAPSGSTVFLVRRTPWGHTTPLVLPETSLLTQTSGALTAPLLLAQADGGDASRGTEPVGSEVDVLKSELEALLDLPSDAPELKTLLQNEPRLLMSASRMLAQEVGNERVIRVVVNALASIELPTTPSTVKGRRPTPNPWLDALASAFYTPEILSSAENTAGALRGNLKRLQEPTAETTPDGRPMPRKRMLDASGRAVALGHADSSLSLAKSEAELQALIDRYPRFLFQLADHYGLKDNQVNAFETFSRAMVLDFDAWKKVEKRYYGAFLDAATFMVLSAHKTDQVLALYAQVPLKQADLQRLVLEQIDKRTQIYARARTEFTNNAAISQALVDLLQTLIEDASIDDILPPKEKRKFLELIGDAAVARRQYVEAVGVYTALDDTRRLSEVGRQLSQRIYYDRQGTMLINRDLELAIDAFREANDTAAMQELLVRCRQVQALFEKRPEKPTGYPYLEQYIHSLEGAVDSERSAGRTLESGSKRPSEGVPTASPSAEAEIALERLPGLIRTTRDRINSALPGQDVRADKARLLTLGEQAVREGLTNLAIEAFEPLGVEGQKRLIELGRTLAAEDKHASAFEALKLAGKTAYPELILLGQKIVSQGISSKGSFNPDVALAVEAFILTDETDRLEGLLNDMLKLRIQLQQSEASMQGAAHAVNKGNRDALEACIARVAEEYDLVGITYDPSKSPKKPATDAGSAAAGASGGGSVGGESDPRAGGSGTTLGSETPLATQGASSKPAPVRPEPASVAPRKPEPMSATPTRIEPVKPEPTSAPAIKPEPARTQPSATDPQATRTMPTRTAPSRPSVERTLPQDPLDLDPEGEDPAMPEPLATQTTPSRPVLVKPEPVKLEPVKPEPVKVDPLATKTPVKPEPVKPEPVKVDPLATKTPVKPEPVKPEPVKPEPVKPATPSQGLPVARTGDEKVGGDPSVEAEKDPVIQERPSSVYRPVLEP